MRGVAFVMAVAVTGCMFDGGGERGGVHVKVMRAGSPVPEATVIFHDTDGSVLGTTTSDDEGGATGEIGAGGLVTVVDPWLERTLMTVTHVAIDTSIEVVLSRGIPNPRPTSPLTVEAPPGVPPPLTEHYLVRAPCRVDGGYSITLPMTIEVSAPCSAMTEVPILLTASSTGPIEYPEVTHGYVAGVARDGRFTPTQTWSTSCRVVQLDEATILSPTLRPYLGGRALHNPDFTFCEVTPQPGAHPIPTVDLGEGVLVEGDASIAGTRHTASLLAHHATVPASLDIQLTDLLVGDVQLGEDSARRATWTTDAALDSADALVAQLAWSFVGRKGLEWQFVLPAGATGVRVPDLPDDVWTWPPADTSAGRSLTLRFIEASWTDDRDELAERIPLYIGHTDEDPQPPPLGTLRDFEWVSINTGP